MSPLLQQFCTGKFQIIQKYDEKQNQYLEINIEQKRGVESIKASFAAEVEAAVTLAFREKSSEYKELSSLVQDRPLFVLVFHPADDPEHFSSGAKQKWVKK